MDTNTNTFNTNQLNNIDKQFFIRPTQTVVNGDKTFWLVKGLKDGNKKKLNLDSPTLVITFNTLYSTASEG